MGIIKDFLIILGIGIVVFFALLLGQSLINDASARPIPKAPVDLCSNLHGVQTLGNRDGWRVPGRGEWSFKVSDNCKRVHHPADELGYW